MESRSEKSAKNLIVGLFGQLLNAVLVFATRTVFIKALSEEYLGLSGMFTSVISILSLSELGVGSAIIFAMYKPIAEKDEEKVCALMTLYSKAYRIIGLCILGIGIMLLPVAPYLAKGSTDLVNIRVLFLLYLLDSVSTYLFFAYKSSLLKADQKSYVVYIAEYIVAIIRSLVRIGLLLVFKDHPSFSYYLYCAVGIAFNLISNLFIAIITDKKYPFLKRRTRYKLPSSELALIKKNVIGAFANKLSAAANEISGGLIVSAFIGVTTMGIYSNYLYFVTFINSFVRIFANSISASIGNYNATETKENKMGFLRKLHFIYSWFYGFCAICLWVMLNPFIQVWAGENYVFPQVTVALIVYNFYAYGLLSSISTIQQESGIYWESRFISLLSAGVCITCSLVFTIVLKLGVGGVMLASIISRVLVEFPYRSYITCKYVFEEKAKLYVKMYVKSTVFTLIFAFVYGFGLGLLPVTWLWVIVRLVVCMVTINVIWILIFRKREEYRYLVSVIVFLKNKFLNSRKHDDFK